MTDLTFAHAPTSDALRISVLLKTAYIQAYAEEGISFEFANFIEQRFSVQTIERTIIEYPEQIIAAYFKGNPVGVAEIIVESKCPIRQTATAELSKLYVLHAFKNIGVGSELLKKAERVAINNGGKDCILEVYIKNESAIQFYKKHGYHIIGSIDASMETNYYEDLIMTKTLVSQ
jgi:diamine N-acetyltransferase